jgi:hypothetical protein
MAMRIHLKGIHKVKARLADGREVVYFYAWRGGPRLIAPPGSPEFIREFNDAHAARKKPHPGLLFSLIAEYKSSADFGRLAPSSRTHYLHYLKTIEVEFGDMPIAALADPRVRGIFKNWRDRMAGTPRAADYAWTTLARVLAFAKDRGRISTNPCERGGRLYRGSRVEKIWSPAEIVRLVDVANPSMRLA